MKKNSNIETLHFRDIEKVLEYVLEDGMRLQNIPQYQDNAKVVLAAVTKNYRAFEFASSQLKDNDKFVYKCCKISIYCFEHVSVRLKNNEEFVLKILEDGLVDVNDTNYFRNLLSDLYSSHTFVLRALKVDVRYYFNASNEILNDVEFAKKAIEIDYGIYYAELLPDLLHSNEDIVRCAISKNGLSIRVAPKKYQSNFEFVMLAVKNGYPGAITGLPKKFLNDKSFILYFIKENAKAYDDLVEDCPDNKLIYDRDVFMEAVKQNGSYMIYGKYNFGMDKSIALLAVQSSNSICYYENAPALKHLDYFQNDKEVVLASVKTCPSSFQYASDQLKNDKAFVKEVLISGGAEAFEYVSDALKADKSIINLYKRLA
jgi:hypothetical protein